MRNAKEKYSEPEMELIILGNEEVITASNPDDGEWDPAD